MKVIVNNAILNTDYFPVITTNDKVLLFGYEDDFNVPISIYFNSSAAAEDALRNVAQGFVTGERVIEIEGGSFEPN